MPSSIKIPQAGVDGGWMDGYPLDCYDYQSTCGPGGKHSYCSDFRWEICIQNQKSKYCAWKKLSCRKIKGEVCGDLQFPILQMDSSIVRWFEGSQTIVNMRGVQKLHLPSDSCWKFLTHHVICHGEIHRNVNNLLQTFISSPNWAQWLSMVVYHKSNDAMVTLLSGSARYTLPPPSWPDPQMPHTPPPLLLFDISSFLETKLIHSSCGF